MIIIEVTEEVNFVLVLSQLLANSILNLLVVRKSLLGVVINSLLLFILAETITPGQQ